MVLVCISVCIAYCTNQFCFPKQKRDCPLPTLNIAKSLPHLKHKTSFMFDYMTLPIEYSRDHVVGYIKNIFLTSQ